MGTFSRIRYVMAANLNALIEKAEDPEKLLRALIREMEDAGEDARLAVADLMAERQHLDRVTERIEREMDEWKERAERSVAAGRDDLARTALKARAELSANLEAARNDRTALTERTEQLEADMKVLKGKLNDAKVRLREMSRAPATKGPSTAREDDRLSRHERRVRQAMGRFERLQNQVDRLEARVRSYEVGGVEPSPWTDDDSSSDPAIEAELEALKARVNNAPTAGPGTSNSASPEPADSASGEARE